MSEYHPGHPELPGSWEKKYPANEIMMTKTGLPHDVSGSQVYYKQIKIRRVNKEAEVIAIEWEANSSCHEHFEQNNLPSGK